MPALIELVDTEILAAGSQGQTLRVPGYALLEDQGIQTGASALSQAWLYPQRSFNQFWRQLTLAPLPASHRHARHYADLAFAQLRQIHQELGSPEEVIFLLPGSFSRDQLSILLGLANALPVATRAMVDAAVAAASALDSQGDILHLDIQLHQAVITHLVAGEKVSRVAVDIVPDAGLKSFHGAWAQQIADQFIQQFRYDPLHRARDEQQLHDQLPLWIAALDESGQCTAELSTERGNFRLNLNQHVLAAQTAARVARLRQHLDKFPSRAMRTGSYRLHKLPGIAAALGIEVLHDQQALGACRQATSVLTEGGGVSFITEMPRFAGLGVAPVTGAAATARLPTHLLYRHRAHALNGGLGVVTGETGLALTRQPGAPLWFAPEGGRITLRSTGELPLQSNGDFTALKAGDCIAVGSEQLTLIEVPAES